MVFQKDFGAFHENMFFARIVFNEDGLIFQRVFDLSMKAVGLFKGMFGLFHENALSSRVLCFSMKMIDCSKGL